MKAFKIFVIALITATAFQSCKKDDDTQPSSGGGGGTPVATGPTYLGKYIGTYGYDAANNTFYYCLNLKANGVIEELNSSGVKTHEGTYTISGTVFTSSYHPISNPSVTYVLNGTYNDGTHKLTGTWGYSTHSTYTGHFTVTK